MADSTKTYCFLIGAAKAGTSTLFSCFGAHPQIARTRPKETRMFANPSFSEADRTKIDESFVGGDRATVFVEASTQNSQYPLYPHNARIIRRYFPKAKYIYIIRDPLKRIESHYNYGLQKLYIPFGSSLLREELILPSLYASQLDQYQLEFEDGRIHLVAFEDLMSEPDRIFSELFNFLEIDDIPLSAAMKQVNETVTYRVADRLASGALVGGLGRVRTLLTSSFAYKLPVLRREISKRAIKLEEVPVLKARMQPDLARLSKVYGFDTKPWSYTRELFESIPQT